MSNPNKLNTSPQNNSPHELPEYNDSHESLLKYGSVEDLANAARDAMVSGLDPSVPEEIIRTIERRMLYDYDDKYDGDMYYLNPEWEIDGNRDHPDYQSYIQVKRKFTQEYSIGVKDATAEVDPSADIKNEKLARDLVGIVNSYDIYEKIEDFSAKSAENGDSGQGENDNDGSSVEADKDKNEAIPDDKTELMQSITDAINTSVVVKGLVGEAKGGEPSAVEPNNQEPGKAIGIEEPAKNSIDRMVRREARRQYKNARKAIKDTYKATRYSSSGDRRNARAKMIHDLNELKGSTDYELSGLTAKVYTFYDDKANGIGVIRNLRYDRRVALNVSKNELVQQEKELRNKHSSYSSSEYTSKSDELRREKAKRDKEIKSRFSIGDYIRGRSQNSCEQKDSE